MDYPLGSFPRFGHQERWAQERRERAIENSITTRRWNAYWRRQRKAQGITRLDVCQRHLDAENARETLMRLGNVGLDWVRYITRINFKVKVEAAVAPELASELAAIHREFEGLASTFGQMPAETYSPSWIHAVNRMDARYGDLGARIEDLKRRVAAARLGPIRLLWMRLRAWFEGDVVSSCGGTER